MILCTMFTVPHKVLKSLCCMQQYSAPVPVTGFRNFLPYCSSLCFQKMATVLSFPGAIYKTISIPPFIKSEGMYFYPPPLKVGRILWHSTKSRQNHRWHLRLSIKDNAPSTHFFRNKWARVLTYPIHSPTTKQPLNGTKSHTDPCREAEDVWPVSCSNSPAINCLQLHKKLSVKITSKALPKFLAHRKPSRQSSDWNWFKPLDLEEIVFHSNSNQDTH